MTVFNARTCRASARSPLGLLLAVELLELGGFVCLLKPTASLGAQLSLVLC